jgi:hypothetical protein
MNKRVTVNTTIQRVAFDRLCQEFGPGADLSDYDLAEIEDVILCALLTTDRSVEECELNAIALAGEWDGKVLSR